jgi:hypothetical protein
MLKYLMRLFHNLNYEDLYRLFENELDKWMQELIHIIYVQSKSVQMCKRTGNAGKYTTRHYENDIKPTIKVYLRKYPKKTLRRYHSIDENLLQHNDFPIIIYSRMR